MPILECAESAPAAVHCVREVRVGIQRERLEQVEEFYADVLGLERWPEGFQIPGGLGLGSPLRGLLLEFRHDPEVDLVRRRFTLCVGSLDALERRLLESGWPYERQRGLGWSDQYVFVHDPTGHRIELRQSCAF